MAMTRKVYVVMGVHSDWDNNWTWVESVRTSRKEARAEARDLNARHLRTLDSYEVWPIPLNTAKPKHGWEEEDLYDL